jgi:DNA processing protein
MAQDVRKLQSFSTPKHEMQDKLPSTKGQGNLADWLALTLIPNFGYASYAKLDAKLDHPLDIFRLSRQQLVKIGFAENQLVAIQQPNQKKIQQCLNWLSVSPDRFAMCLDDSAYPALLQEIARPPLLLLGIGNKALLHSPQVAMVGSRSPSFYGKQYAQTFSAQLANAGWTITSGLAMGIDGFCHRAALGCKGNTLAVLGSGIDKVYPKRHALLSQQILENDGLIISEFLPGTAISPHNFPRRNRIISGLSLATVVVEAAIKSGSLITARYAIEQNREVFAIPGSVDNPLAQGCHHLIKQGANLLDNIDDIFDAFHHLNYHRQIEDGKNLQKKSSQCLATDKLLDSVGFEVTALDVVVQRSKRPINEVLVQLLDFELRGLVASVPGGYIKLGGK